jgi:hypothetical protein
MKFLPLVSHAVLVIACSPGYSLTFPGTYRTRRFGIERAATSFVITRMSLDNDSAILRIQEDYRQLREKIHQGMEENQGIDPIAITEELLEKASNMVAIQRYQQEQILLDAQKQLRHAQQDHTLAHAIQQQAHEESLLAQQQVKQVESFEDQHTGYEDQERLRDMSIAHAAARLEHDAKDQSVESQFQELEACEKQDEALELLHHLESIEEELRETIKAVFKYKTDHAREEWAKQEAERHENFLNPLKAKLTSIDHDPFKGDVAF